MNVNVQVGILRSMILSVALGLLVASSTLQDPKLPDRRLATVEGWSVYIDKRLDLPQHSALGQQAVRLITNQLINIQVALSSKMVDRLRKVEVFLDWQCGDMFSPAYHPSSVWLKNNGYSTRLEQSVHIPKAEYFTSKGFQTQQPWAVLHEFAHALHHQDLKFDNAEIVQLYEKFKGNSKYETALHVDGNPRKHYGQTNVMEFFAEMSESYVGQNDFFPFNRGELRTSEPEIFSLMRRIWGTI